METLLAMAGWLPGAYFALAVGLGAASGTHIFIRSEQGEVYNRSLDDFMEATPLGMAAVFSLVGLLPAAVAAGISGAGLLDQTPVNPNAETAAIFSVGLLLLATLGVGVALVAGLATWPYQQAAERRELESRIAAQDGAAGLARFQLRERIEELPDGARLIDPETGLRFWTRRIGPDDAPALAVLDIDAADDYAMSTKLYSLAAEPRVLAQTVVAPPTDVEYESALDQIADADAPTEAELVALAEQLRRAQPEPDAT